MFVNFGYYKENYNKSKGVRDKRMIEIKLVFESVKSNV